MDVNALSDLIHTDPDCISSAAIENEAYIQRDYYDKQVQTMQNYLAELTAKREEWAAKWEVASANTKAAIQKAIENYTAAQAPPPAT